MARRRGPNPPGPVGGVGRWVIPLVPSVALAVAKSPRPSRWGWGRKSPGPVGGVGRGPNPPGPVGGVGRRRNGPGLLR